jgi:hypothetical protein
MSTSKIYQATMVWKCSYVRRNEEYIQNFAWKTSWKKITWKI